jgi:hypothetical protein
MLPFCRSEVLDLVHARPAFTILVESLVVMSALSDGAAVNQEVQRCK